MFVFRNGKGVRVDVAHYETKQRRKKLVNAYNDASPLVGIAYDLPMKILCSLFVRQKNKLLVFSSSLIVQKATRQAQGATILRAKNDVVVSLLTEADLHFVKDLNYYKIAKIPTAGRYIREETLEARQLSLTDDV